MLSLVQNMLGPRANPIGVDFGTETLRLAQVAGTGSDMRLLASASADLPSHIRNDPAQRLAFFTKSLKELLASGGFKGRQAVLGLPSSVLSIVHVRVPMMDEASQKKAIPFEARGKLPFDPSHALVRHLVAGEVYQGQEQKLEAIVMASPRATVEGLLAAAGKAKLDVVGINTEPQALNDCFLRMNRSKEDRDITVCYIDIGASGSRVVIVRNGKMMFARSIAIGGDHFTRAVAQAGKMAFEDAKLLRLRLAEQASEIGAAAALEPELAEPVRTLKRATPHIEESAEAPSADHSFAVLGAALALKARAGGPTAVATLAPTTASGDNPESIDLDLDEQPPTTPAAKSPRAGSDVGDAASRETRLVETSIREPLGRLVEELDLCRRYHEATFPSAAVERLVFVGGESRHRSLCSFVAREMGLAATVGDPIGRMARNSPSPNLSAGGPDRRVLQPAWAVALGLSMGPLAA